MDSRSSQRRLPPEGVAETESALRHMVGLVDDPNTPAVAVEAIKTHGLESANTALTDLDAHRGAVAETRDARAGQRTKNVNADEAVVGFLGSVRINSGKTTLDEVLRELEAAPSDVLRQPDRDQVFSIERFITRLAARDLKLPTERFEQVKETQAELRAAISTTDAAVEGQARLAKQSRASLRTARADYSKVIMALTLLLGEDAVYGLLLTFDREASKKAEADETE